MLIIYTLIIEMNCQSKKNEEIWMSFHYLREVQIFCVLTTIFCKNTLILGKVFCLWESKLFPKWVKIRNYSHMHICE